MTKQQRVYELLREEILSGVLAPGQRLLLNQLAERFEVSPIPVREALRQLEREDLIEVLPHVSVIVKELPFEEVLWALEVRLALEPGAARDAVPHASRYHVELMRGELDDMVDGHDDANRDDAIASYNSFHDVLFSITPNRRIAGIIDRQRATARRFRAVTGERMLLASSLTDLSLIAAAIDARNADDVYALVRTHREQVLELLLEWAATQEPMDAVA